MYDNNLKGSLFRNDKKAQPSHPDWKGSAEIDGKQFWISCWSKEAGPQSKTPGMRFLSLSFQPKDAPATQAPATNTTANDDMAPTPIAGAPASAPKAETPAIPYRAPAPKPAENLDEDVPFN